MGLAMVMDAEIQRQIQDVIDTPLAGTVLLKLFTNDITPAPGDDAGDYTEATFDGYAAKDISAGFGAPVQDEPGIYSSKTALQTWDAPALGPAEVVRGIFVTVDGDLFLAKKFDAPITMEVGGDPISLRVIYRQYAAALLEGA